jgi:hypothetical protein
MRLFKTKDYKFDNKVNKIAIIVIDWYFMEMI